MIATIRSLTLLQWLHGLLSAAINGAAGAVSVIIVDPIDFNFTNGKEKLTMVALAMALVQLALYLKDQPLPDRLWDGETDRRKD